MSKEKEVCKGCPKRFMCVELIKEPICPHGLHILNKEESNRIKSYWRGELKICETCNGTGFVEK